MYTFVVHLFFTTQIFCQSVSTDTSKILSETDSLAQVRSTNPFDTIDIAIKDDDVKSPVTYKATDSIVYDIENEMLYLYGDAQMDYESTKVNSERVTYNWKSQTLSAEGVDSMGKKVGTPVLLQEGQSYEANKMDYNFKTQKGKIYDVITEQDGAFIHSEIVKKTKENHWLSYKTKYTTCTDKDHPHFYIQAKRAKIIPDKVMVSGPADLVIAGVNTPLAVPFAIFPLRKGRRSGVIIPKFGPAGTLFTVKDGGYFWAVNDYFNLKFLGEVVTDGTFGINVSSQYAKRYKYRGNVSASYRRVMPPDPILNPYNVVNDFRFDWSHRMDNKADPNNNFSASLRISSRAYNKNQIIQTTEVLSAVNTSNLSYVRRFNNKPFTLSVGATVNQNLQNKDFSATLPKITFNTSRIFPFKSKISSPRKKFYERIGFSYKADALARVSTKDSLLFKKETLDEIQYGINQNVVLGANYSLFKYLDINPSFNYNEQWFFKEETIDYGQYVIQQNDTTFDTLYTKSNYKNGFFARRNFNAGITLSTKLKGIYSFKKGKLKGLRHVFTPRLSYNYRPDFSKPLWKYYNEYLNEETGETVRYNQFAKTAVYGLPGIGEQNRISLSLDNAIEIKVLNKKDSTQRYKKIPILRFTASTGYNFAGDSIRKFEDVRFTANTSILKGLFRFTASLNYNPYSKSKDNRRIGTLYWKTHQKILRFESFSLNVDFNLKGKPKRKKSVLGNEYGTLEEQEFVARNPELFYDFDIPWSLNIHYHFGLVNGSAGDRDKPTYDFADLTFNGNIRITPKWMIDLRSGYNFRDKDFTFTNIRLVRDLHCWQMSLNWQAYPIQNSSFTFELRVKSALLQDLKLTRRSVRYNTNGF